MRFQKNWTTKKKLFFTREEVRRLIRKAVQIQEDEYKPKDGDTSAWEWQRRRRRHIDRRNEHWHLQNPELADAHQQLFYVAQMHNRIFYHKLKEKLSKKHNEDLSV